MTTTPDSPQITSPEAAAEGMVAPGQEDLLNEFIQEQQAEQEPDLIGGKFRSQEDLLKAYQELERKQGQQPEQAETAEEPAEGYSVDQAVEVYGKENVDALQEKGISLNDLMWKADNGEDISDSFDDLAEVFKVPRQVVENYVSKAQSGGDAAPPELTASDEADLKALVGGDQGFEQMADWARSNLAEEEINRFDAVVESNNKDAIHMAIQAMQARMNAKDSVVEPKLIGGGKVAEPSRFESQQQVLDAMNKLNDRGQRLYDVDEAYREKVTKLLASSDVF
tara:strand:+ start:5746 stop:6588 length:843 start_codon:yes stop_codon:yes gene_type:complete